MHFHGSTGAPDLFHLLAMKAMLETMQEKSATGENIDKCKLQESGELRGKTLTHLKDGSICQQEKWLESKINKLAQNEKTINFGARVLAAHTEGKLPPFYLTMGSDKELCFVETEVYLEKMKTNMERQKAKTEFWVFFCQGIFKETLTEAAQITKTLTRANSAAMTGLAQKENIEDVIKSVSEESLAQLKLKFEKLEAIVVDLKKNPKIDSLKESNEKINIISIDWSDLSKIKFAMKIEQKTEELKNYLKIFEACIEGIQGSLNKI